MRVVIAHGGNIGFHGGGTSRVLAFAGALAEAGYEVTLAVAGTPLVTMYRGRHEKSNINEGGKIT